MIGPLLAPPILQGERLRLRPYAHGFSEAEMRRVYAWSLDSPLLQLCGAQPLHVDYERFCTMFRAQLRRRQPGEVDDQLFAILDEQGRLIGRIGLFGLRQSRDFRDHAPGRQPRPVQAELGIMIGERGAWGHGYGREAVRLLVDHGFEQFGLRSIFLYTYPDNLRAQRAFTAAGFRPVRTVRRFSLSKGAHDELEMTIYARQPGPPVHIKAGIPFSSAPAISIP